MKHDLGYEFLLLCKQNYFNKITPANSEIHTNNGYVRIVCIAREYFANLEYEEFAGFFQEGQYFVALWTAHMLLEYGTPNYGLTIAALKIIKEYSENPLAPDVAEEEKQWLKENAGKYK
jgi:hypothetical protein